MPLLVLAQEKSLRGAGNAVLEKGFFALALSRSNRGIGGHWFPQHSSKLPSGSKEQTYEAKYLCRGDISGALNRARSRNHHAPEAGRSRGRDRAGADV
jgi:hypothetical protein